MAVRIRYLKNYISKDLEPATTNDTLKPLVGPPVVLPSGGTWAYVISPSPLYYKEGYYRLLNQTIEGTPPLNLVGIASGGSTIATFDLHISNGAIAFAGFAWRVA